ncbi:hypothetical protein NLI96_g282 [Meripilus lineatus]|uniref:Fatty acid desaturase domain-containing protein n=1 Tax=Meripilus lineatus TaxID=2056292 RepID=A0AAD5YP14_9APHY|nr:hypothetical protein NLI96_g282 [Physisporinus lineatus]
MEIAKLVDHEAWSLPAVPHGGCEHGPLDERRRQVDEQMLVTMRAGECLGHGNLARELWWFGTAPLLWTFDRARGMAERGIPKRQVCESWRAPGKWQWRPTGSPATATLNRSEAQPEGKVAIQGARPDDNLTSAHQHGIPDSYRTDLNQTGSEKPHATQCYWGLSLWTILFYKAATYIPTLSRVLVASYGFSRATALGVKWTLWAAYWWWESVALAGWWCLVDTSLSIDIKKATNSVERDENYVPLTRKDYGLPDEKHCQPLDYHEIFEETPIYTLGRMLAMQLLGWQFYLFRNTLGSPQYPPGANHFLPSSPLFKPHERNGIIASNIGLAVMVTLLGIFASNVGFTGFIKFYFIPYLLANHWIVMLTFLHHTDPTLPHYRNKEWTWVRGAFATVDRPLLGPVGRFFLHNVSHDHIAHHIFSNIPFYNQPQVTEILKQLLKDDYNYDSTNTFYALYRSFSECCFIEDDGDIVFYKNRDGKALRTLASASTE